MRQSSMISDQSTRLIKARTSDYLASQILLGVTEKMTNKEIKEHLDSELLKIAVKSQANSGQKDLF